MKLAYSGIVRHLLWQVRKEFNLFPFEQKLSHSRIIAHHRRCGVSALIHSQGMYDYNNMHLVRFLLQEGGVFFDVGANIGSYTIIASEQPKARVVAFEPHPITFQYLQANVDLNRRSNVCLQNVAVGAEEGFVLLTDAPGSSINRIATANIKNTIEVPCIRLDRFCKQHQINPRILKIDVEGFEQEVLEGLGYYLSEVELLFIELTGDPTKQSQTVGLLCDTGLQGPFTLDHDSKNMSSIRMTHEDRIFISSEMKCYLEQVGFRFTGTCLNTSSSSNAA